MTIERLSFLFLMINNLCSNIIIFLEILLVLGTGKGIAFYANTILDELSHHVELCFISKML